MSNMKQMGLGLMQYVQDNDERYAPSWHGIGSQGLDGNPNDIETDPTKPGGRFIVSPSGTGSQNHYRTWMDFIYPYVKSIQLFACPSNRIIASTPNYGYSTAFSGFYNASLMYTGTAGPLNVPISMAVVTRPSEVICITDFSGNFAYSTSPSGVRGHAENDASTYVTPHLDGGTSAYADGHAKWRSRQTILADLGSDRLSNCNNNPYAPITGRAHCSRSWNPYVH